MTNSTDIIRRRLLACFSFIGLGAVAGLATARAATADSPKHVTPTYTRLSIPDDWYIVGYKSGYHRESKDPRLFVDLVALVGRTGGCSAGFARRLMIATAESVEEANEGIAYLNRGIRQGWLIHMNDVPGGMPLENLERYFGIVPKE